MTAIEKLLHEYPIAKNNIRRLQLDLEKAIRDKDNFILIPGHGYDAVRSKNKKISDPTAKAAIVLADSLAKQVRYCESRIADEWRTIDTIEKLIKLAGLDKREMQFIEFKYQLGHSNEKTCRLMFCSERTLCRMRNEVLSKLEKAMRDAQ